MDGETFTETLGPKCPECGWRSPDGTKHRPTAVGQFEACSRWVAP